MTNRSLHVVVHAPSAITTARLVLRRPTAEDAPSIFAYASDAEVTRYMSFPTHRALDETHAFLEMTDRAWRDAGVGAYVITCDDAVVGSTGLHLLEPHGALTGYVLRRDAWRRGYATEACRAMLEVGRALGLARIEALCHIDHASSAHVLHKAGLTFERILQRHGIFPNLSPEPQDVRSYAWTDRGTCEPDERRSSGS